MSVDGRNVLIIGSSGCLGRSLVACFVDSGANVFGADANPAGSECESVEIDVLDPDSVERGVSEARSRLGGPIEVLVNAAGIAIEGGFGSISDESWAEIMNTNLFGTVRCCRAVLPEMVHRQWGRIINISSQIGIKGGSGLSAYAASKGAVISLTRSLALEFAADNVLVNSIAPGPIESPMIDAASEEWRSAKLAELPLGRFGKSYEIAPTAVMLADDPGGNVYVGQTLGPNSGDVMP